MFGKIYGFILGILICLGILVTFLQVILNLKNGKRWNHGFKKTTGIYKGYDSYEFLLLGILVLLIILFGFFNKCLGD
ncbi:MAG: hypothetical protein A2705_03990 [Omnitrophica WOR_2 bacterium RIFCSPHIGHO2_01_FULL_52_10]|nr:MAG: hypothetical protein A2705_03990 [Omnitrophica WOR_2 bacterium RIFCSPHIGHO2_01_FULL_52_10]